MKFFKLEAYKEYSIFFWIFLVAVIGILISTVYTKNKDERLQNIKSSLENIYLKKTVKEITNNLEPRYTLISYVVKAGDTHQTIINKLDISNNEKKKYT